MKKFIAFFLLFVFLCNAAGIFGLFFYLKQDNYEFVFSRHAGELELMHLVIPKTKKIQWEKKNEIVYEGKYYDVFGKSEDDKNIYLLCYNDSKDDRLTEALHKQLSEQNNNSPNKKVNHRISLKITLQNYLLQSFCWNLNQPSVEKISTRAFNRTLSGFKLSFYPPPDFLV